MKNGNGTICLAGLLGGFAGLAYELVWNRYLALLLGSTAYAVGVVTACYMAGLALGGFLLGRLGERWERGAARVAFGGFAALCVLSPVLYRGAGALSRSLSRGVEAPAALLALRIGLSALVLLPGAACVGGMTPILMKVYRRETDSSLVYAMVTLGSVLGALVTGLFLLPAMGLGGSGILAGVCSGCALVCVEGSGRRQRGEPRRTKGEPAYSMAAGRYALVLYGASGFTAMAFEIYQTKLLTLFFMDSVYDFTLILTIFLVGFFLGNCLGDRLAAREGEALVWLGLSQAAAGLLCLVSLIWTSRMPGWTETAASAEAAARAYAGGAFSRSMGLKAGYGALVALPPAICWGCAFPLASRIFLRDRDGVSARSGLLTGWNTVGSALGSLLGGFVLIPLLGFRGGIVLGAAINVALALGCVPVEGKAPHRTGRAGIWGLSALALAVFVLLPGWDRFEMSTSFLKPGQDVTGAAEMLYYQEDAGGITSVVHFLPNDVKYLTTNRLYCQSTADLGGPEDHRRLGVIPLLLHPDPEDVLLTGLGSGVTLRGAADYGDAEIDCVEISRSVVEAARCFEEENGEVLDRENVHIIIEDARNYMARTNKRYDVIVGDIFFPMSSGSSGLFSREYYQDVMSRLKEGGVMVQWLPIHQFSREELELTANTFASVFPQSYAFLGLIGESVPAVGLVGTLEPLKVDLDGLKGVYEAKPELRAQLETIALDDPYMLLSHYIGPIQPGDGAVLTDDKPLLEYRNPRNETSYAQRGRENLAWLMGRKAPSSQITDARQEDAALLDEYDQMILEFAAHFYS